MLEFIEIELGGEKRKGRLSWHEMVMARHELQCDPFKLFRGLLAEDEHGRPTLADPAALEILLCASLRPFQPGLTVATVAGWIAEVDRQEQERNQRAGEAMMQLQAETPGMTLQEAAVQVYGGDPTLAVTTLTDVVNFVCAARRVGGVRQEPAPKNAGAPELH